MQLLSSKWDYCRVIFLVNFTKKNFTEIVGFSEYMYILGY